MRDLSLLEVLNNTTDDDYFSEFDFNPGKRGYVNGPDWFLAVYVSITATQVLVENKGADMLVLKTKIKNEGKVQVAGNILELLDKFMPGGRNNPTQLLPGELPFTLSRNATGIVEKNATYSRVKALVLRGSDNSSKILEILSGHHVATSDIVLTHVQKDDVMLFYGMVYCIGSNLDTDLGQLQAFYNLSFQPDYLKTRQTVFQLLQSFESKFQSNNFGIFADFPKLWQAFRFYFPVPTHMLNPTVKIFNILPKLGQNNSGDFTTDAYYDKIFGWVYPMTVVNDSGTADLYALEYYLINVAERSETKI
jgi:hypothetical protein